MNRLHNEILKYNGLNWGIEFRNENGIEMEIKMERKDDDKNTRTADNGSGRSTTCHFLAGSEMIIDTESGHIYPKPNARHLVQKD